MIDHNAYPVDDSYFVCFDAVEDYICPTCGQIPGLRCVTTSGRELSIMHTHRPRVAQAHTMHQCEARNPHHSGRCQRMTGNPNHLCAKHQGWKP